MAWEGIAWALVLLHSPHIHGKPQRYWKIRDATQIYILKWQGKCLRALPSCWWVLQDWELGEGRAATRGQPRPGVLQGGAGIPCGSASSPIPNPNASQSPVLPSLSCPRRVCSGSRSLSQGNCHLICHFFVQLAVGRSLFQQELGRWWLLPLDCSLGLCRLCCVCQTPADVRCACTTENMEMC